MNRGHKGAAAALALVIGAWSAVTFLSIPDHRDHDPALVEAGRRIYQDGVLPDGTPLIATRPEGLVLEGRYAACSTCHRRSGMGSIEGLIDAAILVPPIVGPVLFADSRFANSLLDESHHYVPHASWRRAMTRPAYDDHALEDALRTGANSAGELMGAPMPLYNLDEIALQALTAFLRQLGNAPDPGVTDGELHIAAVSTPGVDSADRAGLFNVLRTWAESARVGNRRWVLHEWHLRGAPASWKSQLKAAYREQPVFATISGIGAVHWDPVHEFCEETRLPCVMPSVQMVPVQDDTHFSMYLSQGVKLEARILARFLKREDNDGTVRQVWSGELSQQAAGELEKLLGSGAVKSLVVSPDAASGLSSRDSVMLWLRASEIMELADALPNGLAARRVYVSSLLANPEDLNLPPAWREQTVFVSLFDDLGLQGEIARLRLARWLDRHKINNTGDPRIQADAYAVSHFFNKALATVEKQELRRPAVPLTREHLLETLEDVVAKYSDGTRLIDEDTHVAWYGRMSLGPGQRIAVRGGSVLRYSSPDSARLVRVGKRIVP